MTNPAIQNDFSYYRRTISRNRLNNQQVRQCRKYVYVAYDEVLSQSSVASLSLFNHSRLQRRCLCSSQQPKDMYSQYFICH